MATRLYYVGDRAAVQHYLPGLPARDLTDADLEDLAAGRGQTAVELRDELAATRAYQKSTPEDRAEPEPAPAPRRAARQAPTTPRRSRAATRPEVRAPEPPVEVQAPMSRVAEVRAPWQPLAEPEAPRA